MITIMENNSVITALLDLKLRDDDGEMVGFNTTWELRVGTQFHISSYFQKSVLNLPLDVLKRYCHLDQVADFANFTLFLYNSNNTLASTEIRLAAFYLLTIV